jgi:flotillin
VTRGSPRAQAVEAESVAEKNSRQFAAQAVEAEGIAEKNRRIAAADALRAEGDAEADAIRAKGSAEAESARARAEALEERATELLRQQLIEQLPAIVRAASEPLSAISNMTVISGDGATQLGQSVAGQLATSTQIIKDLVGIDIAEIVTGRATGEAAGAAIADATRKAAAPKQ